MALRLKDREQPTHTTKAREEVKNAEDRVAELRGAIERGEDVAGSDLMSARAELEAAELRVTAAQVKDNAERRAGIDAELQAVGSEIATTEAPDFPALLREVHTAARALVLAVNDHNARVTRWAGAIRRLGATDTTFTSRGGAVSHDGYVQAPASISGLLGRVFTTTMPRGRSGRPSVGLTEATPEHVEQAVAGASDKALDSVLRVQALAATTEAAHHDLAEKASRTEVKSVIVDPLREFDADAMKAAFLRYRRDVQGVAFDANRPGVEFPDWIDRADYIEHVPDYETGQRMETNRIRGFGFTDDPGATVRAVGVSGREYEIDSTAQVRPDSTPAGVVVNGKAVLSDSPI